jgi:hypothetical protein
MLPVMEVSSAAMVLLDAMISLPVISPNEAHVSPYMRFNVPSKWTTILKNELEML